MEGDLHVAGPYVNSDRKGGAARYTRALIYRLIASRIRAKLACEIRHKGWEAIFFELIQIQNSMKRT